MKASQALTPFACLGLGVALGAFVVPGPYVYGEVKGAHYRVNRFTGVEQYASSKGWVSQQEFVQDSMSSALGGMFGGLREAVDPSPRRSSTGQSE